MSGLSDERMEIPEPKIYSSLVKLSRCGDIGRVKQFLSSEPEQTPDEDEAVATFPAISAKDDYNCSSVAWSVRNGYVKLSTFLLDSEADAESNSFGGMKVCELSVGLTALPFVRPSGRRDSSDTIAANTSCGKQ